MVIPKYSNSAGVIIDFTHRAAGFLDCSDQMSLLISPITPVTPSFPQGRQRVREWRQLLEQRLSLVDATTWTG